MKHPIPAGSGGFTLLELLVVMGIISGLIMVAVPKYGAYRAKAFDTRWIIGTGLLLVHQPRKTSRNIVSTTIHNFRYEGRRSTTLVLL